jgi:PAS domain S-box-containing protein
MIAPPRAINEAARLEALLRYQVLDTLPELALDDLTALAAYVCEVPIALISLVDDQRQWFKSSIGFTASCTPRDISFSGHAILQSDLFIVPDATKDERFANNPMVTGEPYIRFYAGAPVLSPDGQALGSLCVIDRVPRELSVRQREVLRVLSRQVTAQLELRRQTHELVAANQHHERQKQGLRDAAEFSRQIITDAREGIAVFDRELRYRVFNPFMEELQSWPADTVLGRTVEEILPTPAEVAISARLRRGLAGESLVAEDRLMEPPEVDLPRWVSSKISPFRNAEGAIVGVIAILHDITERKLSEEALRGRESLLSEAQRIGRR